MESRQYTAHAGVIGLRLTRDRVRDGLFAVGDTEGGEVHTQLKAEVEELVIHVRPVLRLLCPCRNNEQEAKP